MKTISIKRVAFGFCLVASLAIGHAASTGMALCIGIDAVDPNRYPGFKTPLKNAQNDAESMAGIVRSQGFKVVTLKGSNALRSVVLSKIQEATDNLVAGDIFMLSFAGHGSVVPDENGDEPINYKYDQTWCLFDGELTDDDLNTALAKFKNGVRIILFSDSCHSGSIIKVEVAGKATDIFRATDKQWQLFQDSKSGSKDLRPYRQLPLDVARTVYIKNKAKNGQELARAKEERVIASAISISACKDDELASDNGGGHGVFTEALLNIWKNGEFTGNYAAFHSAIRLKAKEKNRDQSAVLMNEGQKWPNFEKQKPFTLVSPSR